MIYKFIATFAASIILAPTVAAAEPVNMVCSVKGKGGWIPEQIFFEHDSARDAARVIDGVIMRFEGASKAAEISEHTDKKLVIKWTVATRVSNQTSNMAYRLAYFKQTGKVLVKAQPHGFVNNFTARGRCQETGRPLPAG